MLLCCGRHTCSQLENEAAASASSVRTGDRSQLAELCCSNMFSMSAPPAVTQHLPLLASFSVCTTPSRPVPDRHTASLSRTVSCTKGQGEGLDPKGQTTALVLLQKMTQIWFMTSVLMRFISLSDKIPKVRMTKIWMTSVLVEVMCRSAWIAHVLIMPA